MNQNWVMQRASEKGAKKNLGCTKLHTHVVHVIPNQLKLNYQLFFVVALYLFVQDSMEVTILIYLLL